MLKRTEQTVFNGQPAWIKRPEPPRKSRFVPVHKMLGLLLPVALRPTNAMGGMDSLHAEAIRLREFGDAGLPVPVVLAETETELVLSDCGVTLRTHLQGLRGHNDQIKLITNALSILMQIHNSGFVHGRPHLRDYLINHATGKLSILDLEETPLETMSLPDAQARDFWLFLGSVCELFDAPQEALTTLKKQYFDGAPAQVKSSAIKLARALRPFRRLVGLLRAQNLGRDVFGTYWATRVLEQE